MTEMERLVLLLVLAGFLPAWESILVQGRPNDPWMMQELDLDRITGEAFGRFPFWNSFGNDKFLPLNNKDIFASAPIFEPPPFPPNGLSFLKPETSWQMFPSQGGISSSSAILTGPGTISGSSGPHGSLVTGTGNWNAFAPMQPLQGTAPNTMTGNKTTSSTVFFPSQGGVSSSHVILTGPGTISGSSGPDGSFISGTGNWNAHSPLQQQNDTSGNKTDSSVVIIPSQGGVSSSRSALKGTGSISGYSGSAGSLVTGTGDWQVFPPISGSTVIKGVPKNSMEGLLAPIAYSNALGYPPALSPYNNRVQTVPLIYLI